MVPTSFFCSNHQRFSRLPPPLPGLGGDAKHIDGLWLEVSHHVLASAGVQHVHSGRVAVAGVQVVRDLVGWN